MAASGSTSLTMIPLDAIDAPSLHHYGSLNNMLDEYRKKAEHRSRHFLGYPNNLEYDFEGLDALGRGCIENFGDPYTTSDHCVDSKQFERGVLDWFADLWELDRQESWGYVTAGGTEGNMVGILIARELHPDGVLYLSQESHYSVFKAARMFRVETVTIPTEDNGEMDYKTLRCQLGANAERPAIISLNIGTTMKGAIDSVDTVVQVLRESGFGEDRCYLHCDGAIFGPMLPFLKRAPVVSFRQPIDSISISGHKFIGMPLPCGLVLARRENFKKAARELGFNPVVNGSHDGRAAVYLWFALSTKGREGLQQDVEKCVENSRALKTMLTQAGLRCWMNKFTTTVVFERPWNEAFERKWSIACQEDFAHVVVMPHMTLELLTEFVHEFSELRYNNSKTAAATGQKTGGMVSSLSNGATAEAQGVEA